MFHAAGAQKWEGLVAYAGVDALPKLVRLVHDDKADDGTVHSGLAPLLGSKKSLEGQF